MTVKRYEPNFNYSNGEHYPWGPIEPADDGDYVLYTDYDALQAELDALKSALQLAKPAIEAGANCIHTFMIHTNDVEVPTVYFRINGMKYEEQLRALAEIVK